MKHFLLSTLFALAFPSDALAQARDGVGLPTQLEAQADRIAQLLAGAQAIEFRTARRYHLLDVNGDGLPDPVVLLAIEGVGLSKRFDAYIAVFHTEPLAPTGQRARPSGYRLFDFLHVGSRGVREVDFEKLSFAGGVLTLEVIEPGEKGAAGRRSPLHLRLGADGRLTEAKP